ncbi:hypothetical protein [Streptomyces sp. NPDC059874]|uniref:hypothetical protein n=1 Tax=Streptomyces sp. NPDC059874 TaxID=3346983 RepID=UPI0036551BB0
MILMPVGASRNLAPWVILFTERAAQTGSIEISQGEREMDLSHFLRKVLGTLAVAAAVLIGVTAIPGGADQVTAAAKTTTPDPGWG